MTEQDSKIRTVQTGGFDPVRNAVPVLKTSEQSLQIAVVHHFRQIERMTGGFMLFHTPNGGYRGKRQASLLKAMGVLAGVPDLIFLAPRGKIIFIEMKKRGGSLSVEQKHFQRRITNFGFDCYTVTAAEKGEAVDKVTEILKGHGVLK